MGMQELAVVVEARIVVAKCPGERREGEGERKEELEGISLRIEAVDWGQLHKIHQRCVVESLTALEGTLRQLCFAL
ncbi:hypothetical protein CJ030_MR1G014124 [Morella rubra]|uniref:Uncharacterized protein n=1 Tax=Morella rubra TaxID=262757 RepID=A0A6A1WRK7_9ROSI|nr:hypothetical protein CJ030_MR1G014124 [Morella rubra]